MNANGKPSLHLRRFELEGRETKREEGQWVSQSDDDDEDEDDVCVCAHLVSCREGVLSFRLHSLCLAICWRQCAETCRLLLLM